MVTKGFANDSLDAIPRRRLFAVFLCNRQPEPWSLFFSAPEENCEISIPASTRPPKYATEACFVEEPVTLFESVTAAARFRKRGSLIYGVNRARPFARRRLITRRPALVAMRARNPWVRARLILLG